MGKSWDHIQAIILDLGGVILNIDYQRTIDAFQALGFSGFDQQYSQMQQSGLFDDLETGKLTEAAFVSEIQAIVPSASRQAIIDAWNALLLDFPDGRIDFVRRIAAQWPTFLLSNTNAIHYRAFNQTLRDQTELADIKELFVQAYLSHEIGIRKPDVKAFSLILEEHKLRPESVLFIDDSEQHIRGAQLVGIQAHHLVAPERLEDLFSFLA